MSRRTAAGQRASATRNLLAPVREVDGRKTLAFAVGQVKVGDGLQGWAASATPLQRVRARKTRDLHSRIDRRQANAWPLPLSHFLRQGESHALAWPPIFAVPAEKVLSAFSRDKARARRPQ